MQTDYLIVGQGIAGSLLAHFLLKKGQSVMVVDNGHKTAASKVASGIINPVTGRRLVKSWMIDELLPFAEKTYRELETILETKFLYKRNIYKIFNSIEEENDWAAKAAAQETAQYLTEGKISEKYSSSIRHPLGGFEVTGSIQLDMKLFCQKMREYLKARSCFVEDEFVYEDLKIGQEDVSWKNIQAKNVVFCEGFKGAENPWFSWLPYVLAKGELLTIKAGGLTREKIIKKSVFVMPNEHHIALKKRVNDNESPICSVIPSGVEESRFAAKEDSFPIASGLGMTHGLKTGTGTLPGHLPLPQREVSPQGRHDMAGGFEPLRNTLYKVGATYTWSDLTLTPSEAGKQELLKKLQDTISVPFEVVKHEAGIRPTTKQRRPFLGRHPEVQQLAVFNGLGTKGASLGPWFASEMCEHLISGKVLNEKVACSKLHFPTGQVRL